jgi:O-antigen/teichoic acid export membrane protein
MYRSLIGKIWKSDFVKNVVVLMSGTALAQALQFAVSPVLSRLFEPSAFGLLGVFLATKSIVSVVSAAKYELSIVLPERDEVAANLFVLAVGIVCLVSTFVLIGVVIARAEISTLLGEPRLAPYLWWLSPMVLAAGLYQVLNYWATRKKHYSRLSISQGIRSVGVAGTQVPAGYFRTGPTGLIGGQVAGQVLATVALGVQILREDWKQIRDSVSIKIIKKGAFKHKNFLKFTAPQDLINSISQNAPSYLLVYFFNSSTVGYYWLTKRLLRASSRLIGKAVRKVFYQRASEKYNNGESIYNILVKVTVSLMVIAGIPVVVVVLFGPELFKIIFGSDWYRAGIFSRWMAIWTLFQFANVPSIMTVYILEKQKYLLLFETVLAIGRVSSIPIGYLVGDDVTAIMLFSLFSAVLNVFLILVVCTTMSGVDRDGN